MDEDDALTTFSSNAYGGGEACAKHVSLKYELIYLLAKPALCA